MTEDLPAQLRKEVALFEGADEGTALAAADEIERLREALREIAGMDLVCASAVAFNALRASPTTEQ